MQPFHNPLTRGSTLTTPPKIFLAQHQTLGLNVRHRAKANNKVDLFSDLTEGLTIPMAAILAKDAIKLTDVDPNKPMDRPALVTKVIRMEAREALPEGIPNKTNRLAQHLNRGIEAFCFARFWPFYCFLDSHY